MNRGDFERKLGVSTLFPAVDSTLTSLQLSAPSQAPGSISPSLLARQGVSDRSRG
jgi:hypothetical protein